MDSMGPAYVEYPSLGKSVVTNCGIFMGLPLTWLTLSLFHMYSVKRSEDRYLRKLESGALSEREVATPHRAQRKGPILRYRICGDDLIAVWPKAMVDCYEEVMTEHGCKFSKGKHYRSQRYGVFTEILFRVDRCTAERWVRLNRPVRLDL